MSKIILRNLFSSVLKVLIKPEFSQLLTATTMTSSPMMEQQDSTLDLQTVSSLQPGSQVSSVVGEQVSLLDLLNDPPLPNATAATAAMLTTQNNPSHGFVASQHPRFPLASSAEQSSLHHIRQTREARHSSVTFLEVEEGTTTTGERELNKAASATAATTPQQRSDDHGDHLFSILQDVLHLLCHGDEIEDGEQVDSS